MKLLDVVGAVVTADLVQGLEPNVVQGVPGLALDRWEVPGFPWVAPGRRWRRSRRRRGPWTSEAGPGAHEAPRGSCWRLALAWHTWQ